MTARLGNTEVSTSANNNNISSGDSDVSPELHSTLVSIIDDITSSRDKMGAIKKLYVLIKNNPTLDVSHYLQRTSSVFRRYVLDTLQQMDEQKSRQAERYDKSIARTIINLSRTMNFYQGSERDCRGERELHYRWERYRPH